jgi:serine/threonine protein kinase
LPCATRRGHAFPQVRVLFSTRYDLTGFEDQIADGLVLKDAPYTPEKLLERVRALLTQPVESNEPPPVMVPGTVLGNYQVLERLYNEKEAETYRALQVTVQRPVALVLLKPEHLKKPDIVSKFKERERVKASLTHPRIAPLYEAGETNGWLFYTRELPRGRSLAEIELTDERLSERRLAEVLFGVAEAMQFATERGYHHRSLAPRDIYIDAEHQASIVNIFRPAVAKKRDAKADVRGLSRSAAAGGRPTARPAACCKHSRRPITTGTACSTRSTTCVMTCASAASCERSKPKRCR